MGATRDPAAELRGLVRSQTARALCDAIDARVRCREPLHPLADAVLEALSPGSVRDDSSDHAAHVQELHTAVVEHLFKVRDVCAQHAICALSDAAPLRSAQRLLRGGDLKEGDARGCLQGMAHALLSAAPAIVPYLLETLIARVDELGARASRADARGRC